jgi:hypothetical protein
MSKKSLSEEPTPALASTRTTETSTLLQALDSVLEAWRDLPLGNALGACALERLVREIDRARRQFDSKLFFVVVFGPLKAGKSTLANALAGEYVSPAGFGKETTRRPSLVIQGTESAIDQYFSTEPDVNHFLSQRRSSQKPGETPRTEEEQRLEAKVRDGFDAVADYLRGIRSKEEFQGRIRITTLPLNTGELERALTQSLAAEPLFTVVRCKGGPLLSNGVAIVDMPGLDGALTNWRDDPIHEWVIKRAEFFLFVQSSVAALNNDTQAFLKGIVAQSTKPPVWLVQNIFDARHWLDRARRTRDESGQREEGTKRFVEILGEEPRNVFPLNLGLAWDGKSEKQKVWLEESAFPGFEEGLSEVLNAERASIQEKNCLRNLRQQVEAAAMKLRESEEHLAELQSNYSKLREKLGLAKAALDAVDYRNGWESSVEGAISQMAESAAQAWLDRLDNEIGKFRERHNRKKYGKDLNAELEVVASNLAADGANKYFTKTVLLPQYLKTVEQFCKAAENDAIAKCVQLLTDLTFPVLPAPLAPSAKDVPVIGDDAFKCDKLTERPAWNLGLWHTEYDGPVLLAHIEAVGKDWRQQIQARKDGWAGNILSEHFSTFCEKRRQHFRSHIERLLADFERESQSKNAAADLTNGIVGQMKESLRHLELPLANAIASIG